MSNSSNMLSTLKYAFICKINFFYRFSATLAGLKPSPGPKKKIKKNILLLMTCNIFVVSLLRFELKIYNYTNIMIIK
jgi:hypothetical protein